MADASLSSGRTLVSEWQQLRVVPAEFARGVRSGLRRYHETDRLLVNSLLDGPLFAGKELAAARRIEALRALLASAVNRLAGNARTEPSHRALRYTYLEPAPTQLMAAERAAMSFGTYRRHLSAGIEHVAAELWVRAQGRADPERARP